MVESELIVNLIKLSIMFLSVCYMAEKMYAV